MSFTRDVTLFFPAKQFTADQEQHLRNLVALERWSESGHDFLYLLNKDALPDESDFGIGTLLVENEILKIRKAAGWKTIVDEDSLVGSLPANIAYTDQINTFTAAQGIKQTGGTATLDMHSDIAVPAVGDLLAQVRFWGRDDATAFMNLYASIHGRIDDPTNLTEDGYLTLNTRVAGNPETVMATIGRSSLGVLHIEVPDLMPDTTKGLVVKERDSGASLSANMLEVQGLLGDPYFGVNRDGETIVNGWLVMKEIRGGYIDAGIELESRNGGLYMPSWDADAVNTLRNSPYIQFQPQYWGGAFSVHANFLELRGEILDEVAERTRLTLQKNNVDRIYMGGAGLNTNEPTLLVLGYATDTWSPFGVARDGDTNPRFAISRDGRFNWYSDGSSNSIDTELYRHAANFLRTPDGFMADGGLYVWRTGQALEFKRLADTQARFKIDDSGLHEWGPGGVTAVDTNLYRDVASRLKTDDMLHVVDGVATKTKAGALVDGDFTAGALDGLLGVDTTNNDFMFRAGGAWHTLTPGGGGGGPTVAMKAADEIRDSGTTGATLTDDADLQFAIGANEKWTADFTLIVNANATPDFKWTFVGPAGCSGYILILSSSETTGANPADDPKALGTSDTMNGDGADSKLVCRVIFLNGGTAGTARLQWAQNTSSSSDTILRVGSNMIAHQLA